MRVTINSIPEVKNPPTQDFSIGINRDEAEKIIANKPATIQQLQEVLKDALRREYNASYNSPTILK